MIVALQYNILSGPANCGLRPLNTERRTSEEKAQMTESSPIRAPPSLLSSRLRHIAVTLGKLLRSSRTGQGRPQHQVTSFHSCELPDSTEAVKA